MAARLDNSENWVIDYSTIEKGNPKDILIDYVLIVHMTREPSEDKTW